MVSEPERAAEAVGQAQERAANLTSRVKPKLRGWLHVGTAPLALISAVVLVLLAPSTRTRAGVVIFGSTAVLLFTTSAIFHRGTWSPRWHGVLQRLDHANIFLIIAGTYTPFALALLPTDQARQLLLIVWSGALLGVVFRIGWVNAPRWLYVLVYLALGWVSVFYFASLHHHGGAAVVGLLALGGLLYTVGAVVYGFRRPDPWPRWFGFHEVFHACTVLAFAAHVAGMAVAVHRTVVVG